MKESILTIKNISKKYDNFQLNDINIDIPYGSIVGFIGENGAGKTTTIKAILNLINLNSGSVEILGKTYEDEVYIKENIGVVLDDSYMPEQLTPNDINIILKNIYKNWDSKTYFNYLDLFKLPKNKIIKEFSTGMKVKLKIASAISHNPKLLILDEPTSGLDPIARSEILEILENFVEDKEHSVFVSSHITSDLEQIADYIIFINKGNIVLNIEIDKLINNYAIVEFNEEKFNKIDKKDIIRFKKNKNGYQVLTDNKDKFKSKYNIKNIDKVSIDEVMLLYIKGDKYE